MLIFESSSQLQNEQQMANYIQQEAFKMFNTTNGAGAGTASTLNGQHQQIGNKENAGYDQLGIASSASYNQIRRPATANNSFNNTSNPVSKMLNSSQKQGSFMLFNQLLGGAPQIQQATSLGGGGIGANTGSNHSSPTNRIVPPYHRYM